MAEIPGRQGTSLEGLVPAPSEILLAAPFLPSVWGPLTKSTPRNKIEGRPQIWKIL